MRIYEITEGKKCYWTEGKGRYTSEDGIVTNKLNFWSSLEPLSNDKRDFFIIKAFLLYLAMKLNGNKVKLEFKKKWIKK